MGLMTRRMDNVGRAGDIYTADGCGCFARDRVVSLTRLLRGAMNWEGWSAMRHGDAKSFVSPADDIVLDVYKVEVDFACVMNKIGHILNNQMF